MKRAISFMALIIAVSLSSAAIAKETKVEPTATTNVVSDLVEIVAKVKHIDHVNRRVELEGPNGNLVSLKVGEDVKNFKQIKKGDDVVVKYSESLIWTLKKRSGKVVPSKTITTEASTAAPGQKPASDKSVTLDLVATITAIDKKIPTVTLKGPQGNTLALKLKDPKSLDGVKVGDEVDITYSESLAVAVEKAPKK